MVTAMDWRELAEEPDACTIRKMLLEYLKYWQAWVNSGAPEDKVDVHVSRGAGLCPNVEYWVWTLPLDEDEDEDRQELVRLTVEEELQAEFTLLHGECEREDGSNSSYPFGGNTRYMRDAESRTSFANEMRLEWVRETIKRLEDELEKA